MARLKTGFVIAGLVAGCVALAPFAAKAHVWFDLYGPDARGHSHVHLPHFMSSYYYSSRPHDHPHHQGAYRKQGGSCDAWRQRCAANWGRGNANYRGCMAYHRCR